MSQVLHDITVYVMKQHTATQYLAAATTVKKVSFALYQRLHSFAKQDEKQAEVQYKCAVESGNFVVQSIQLPFISAIDDLDTDATDVAIDLIRQIQACEETIAELMKRYNLNGYYNTSFYRAGMLKRILKYFEDGSLYGSNGPEAFECGECGYIIKKNSANAGEMAPELCPSCHAKQSAFVRCHEIGGW